MRGSNEVKHALISSLIARSLRRFLLLISVSAENPNSQSHEHANGGGMLTVLVLINGYSPMDHPNSFKLTSNNVER